MPKRSYLLQLCHKFAEKGDGILARRSGALQQQTTAATEKTQKLRLLDLQRLLAFNVCDSKGCLEFCLKWSLSVAPFGLCRCVIRADCHRANTSGHHHPVDGPKNESSHVFSQLPSTASLLWCTFFSAVRVVDMLEESPSTLGVQPPLLEMQRPS